MNPKTCPTCHQPIPADAPGGLCPTCVLRDAEEPPPSLHPAPSLEQVAAAFPKLEILGFIGQGGMGSVYKARQPNLDRVVALKILAPELRRDPGFEERFAREARTLAKLHHPNIVAIYDYGESGGFFHLLMEHVEGVNLRQAMRAGRFTPEQALAIVPGICDALQAAHAEGIWHRDIKPENILLDARGGVKIADFGIARIVGDPRRDFTLTMTGGVLGSAAYMAPEQHERPHDVDHRADIYSLGVVIYEMLTGELPLGRFPPPSRRAEVNARIDDIVLRTLAKERELRHQSATEVKTDVQGAATAKAPASDAPAAEPASAPGTGSPLARLPRLVLWSLVLFFGGAALGGAGFFCSRLALALGAASLVVGFFGLFWALYEMKRGWIPPVGRWLLLALTVVPLASGALAGAAVLLAEEDIRYTKGELPLQVGGVFGALGLVLGILFLLARPLRPATERRRRLGRLCIALAAAASVSCAVLTKRFDSHWPMSCFAEQATVQLPPQDRPDDARLLSVLKRAAGPFADDYLLEVKDGLASVMVVTRQPPAYRDLNGTPSTHANNCLLRYLDLLPPAGSASSSFVASDPSTPANWQRQTKQLRRWHPHYRLQVMALATLAILGALLAALAGGRRAVWVVAGGVALHGLLVALPVWPVAETGAPRVVDAPPLPPKLAPEEMPVPDFSTPEKAVMSVFDARYFGRLDFVKRGLSKELSLLVEAHPTGWEGLMLSFNGDRNVRRFSVTSSERDKRDDGLATIHGEFVSKPGGPVMSIAVFEEGEWKLDSFDSRYRATARQRGETAIPRAGDVEIVAIAADGSLTLAGKPCPAEKLRDRLTELAAKQPLRVEIRAEATVPYQDVLRVVAHCRRAGIWNVTFNKAPEKPEADEAPRNSTKDPEHESAAVGEAMKQILEAARNRNAAVFQKGFSKSFQAELKAHGDSLNFGDFGQCSFVSATTPEAGHAEAVVEANDGSKRRFTFRMVFEDGEWKLDGLGTRPRT